MEVFIQDNYAEPSDHEVLKRLPEEALTIHKRSNDNVDLVIFVHGLGGSRYGENCTWGSFPRFLFEDMPQLDIGLYEYRTLFGRRKFWKSVSLSGEAEAFGDIIRDIGQYQKIFLVGHSMGGLLCMAAIAYLIESKQHKVLARIGGLILMATPQTGSQRILTPLSWFSNDFRALKPHGAFVTDLHRTFVDNRVVIDDSRAQTNDIVIPTWAVLGTSDHWVDKLSAGLNIPAERKKTVRGSHKDIVKPSTKTSDAYEYVRDRIKQAFRRQTAGQAAKNFDESAKDVEFCVAGGMDASLAQIPIAISNHPPAAASFRTPGGPCTFYIRGAYQKRKNWDELGDVEVELLDHPPSGLVFLIPSKNAPPIVRDSLKLRRDAEARKIKQEATAQFVSDHAHERLSGEYFQQPSKSGGAVTKVYCREYDEFLTNFLRTRKLDSSQR